MTTTARRLWALIAPTQSNKATTANDRFQSIEDALDDLLEVDLTASSVTLSAAEWSGSAGFFLTGTDTSGRTVTVPAQEGARDFFLDDAWTHNVNIVRGSTTYSLTPGNGVRVFADGTTNGLHVIAASAPAGATGLPMELQYALSDETTDITAGTAKLTVRPPAGFTLTEVRGSLSAASSSGAVTVDVNVGGSTVLSTKLTIDASERTSLTAATPAVISSATIADDAEITFDIDGAGTGAKGLKVTLIGTRT